MLIRTTCLLASVLSASTSCYALEPLRYQNPKLVVDLGVGLWAWPLPCDADQDGDYDLIVSCPDKPSNGVYVFENISGDTAKNPLPIFRAARRISATVPYVMPSYRHGTMKVLSPGWEYENFAQTGIERKKALPIAKNPFAPQGKFAKVFGIRHNQWRYADFNGDGRDDLIIGTEDWSHYGWDNAWDAQGRWKNGSLLGTVHIFHGRSDGSFGDPYQLLADGKPLETFGCPSPNFDHFDADDDLDLICGSFLDGMTYYENSNTNSEPLYAAGVPLLDPQGNKVTMHVQMIVPVSIDWDKDGDVDLIVGDEDGRVAFIEHTGQFRENVPIFQQPKYFSQQADTLKCGALATPFAFDWDGDGDQDILSGNTAGTIEWFENLSGKGVEQPRWAAPRSIEVEGKPFRIMAGANGSIQGPAEAKWGYTTINVVDWDHDSLPDILINSILGEVVWLKNKGTRQAPVMMKAQAIEVAWEGATPTPAWSWKKPSGKEIITQWRTTPVAHDLNRDGLIDLIMLDPEGYLVWYCRNKDLTLQAPRRAFLDSNGKPLRLNAKTGGASGRRKLCLTDWDQDGAVDLLLNAANAEFWRQTASTNETWTFEQIGPIAAKNIEGHDVSPCVVDFDDNGIPDFLGGAEDGRFYYLRNPQAKPRD